MSDKIIIKKLKVFGHHGIHKEERDAGQDFVVDLEVTADLKKAAKADSIKKTVDYSELIPKVERVVREEQFDLLEALAERIAAVVLKHKLVSSVKVRVAKKKVQLDADVKSVAVEIKRKK